MNNDLQLETWTRFSSAERKAHAERLARHLPSGFTFQSLHTYTLGEQTHEVAEFKRENATFVLIPGGPITLGYDPDRPWDPTPDELTSWNDSAKEYGMSWTLN